MQHTDVVIIGAGPVGLFGIFACGMLGLKVHVVDALDHVGGQCRALYPEKPIYDIPAHPQILAGELIDNLEAQAFPFSPTYHLGQKVEAILKTDQGWSVVTSFGEKIQTKAIIIAAGVGAFGPNRPPIPGIEDFEGKTVLYYVRNRKDFEDKTLLIAGGGDSAVDWAVNLAEMSRKIYVIHRREKFRASPEMVSQMEEWTRKGKIEMITPYQIHAVRGEKGMIREADIIDLENKVRTLSIDYLLAFFGLSMNLGPIADWGLQLDNKHIKVDPSTMQTNADGIYAIGDVAFYPNKLKLILTGFAEASLAAHQIRQYIYPEKIFHFEYSTTKGIPGATHPT